MRDLCLRVNRPREYPTRLSSLISENEAGFVHSACAPAFVASPSLCCVCVLLSRAAAEAVWRRCPRARAHGRPDGLICVPQSSDVSHACIGSAYLKLEVKHGGTASHSPTSRSWPNRFAPASDVRVEVCVFLSVVETSVRDLGRTRASNARVAVREHLFPEHVLRPNRRLGTRPRRERRNTTVVGGRPSPRVPPEREPIERSVTLRARDRTLFGRARARARGETLLAGRGGRKRALCESARARLSLWFFGRSGRFFFSAQTTRGASVPPGALIAFVQKGLLYLQVEQQTIDVEDESSAAFWYPLSRFL